MKRVTWLAIAGVIVAGCGGAAEADSAQQLAEDVAGAPPQAQVQQGLAAGDIDTGGRVSAAISGGVAGDAEMTDVSFCVTEAGGMQVFAMAANSAQWSISLGLVGGAPEPGTYAVVATEPNAMSVGLIDKSTGTSPSEWQQYNAVSGSVEVTASDAQRVTGSYDFTASPSYPKSAGANARVQGTFDAPPARC